MNRRDFVKILAGSLAASRVGELPNLERVMSSLPPSASILIPRGRSFMMDSLWIANRTEHVVRPRLAIGKQLIYSAWDIAPKNMMDVKFITGFQGYQLEDDEPVILTGQPGTTLCIGGYIWTVPKTRDEKIEPFRYQFWSSI